MFLHIQEELGEVQSMKIISDYHYRNYAHVLSYIIGKTKCERYKKRNAIIRV